MKYLRQFLLILLISFIGELLHEVLPLPVPASVYGFAILFIGLLSGVIKLAHVIPCSPGRNREDTSFWLPLPSPEKGKPSPPPIWPQLSPIGVPVAIITLVSTVVVMIISGKITQFVIHKEAQRKTASSQTKEA